MSTTKNSRAIFQTTIDRKVLAEVDYLATLRGEFRYKIIEDLLRLGLKCVGQQESKMPPDTVCCP